MKYYMFDEYIGKKEKKLNKKKVFRTIILVIIIAVIITFIILYDNNRQFREISDKYIFRKEVHENNLPIIEYDSSKNNNIFAFDKYIGILEENTLKIYNQYSRKEEELTVEISNPIIDTNNKHLAVAEKGGNKIYSISSKKINWEKEIEGNISGISINKEGYTDGNGKLAGDMIYDVNMGIDKSNTIVDPMDLLRHKKMEDKNYSDLLVPLFKKGKFVGKHMDTMEIQKQAQIGLESLDETQKRTLNPHTYPVGLEKALSDKRSKMIAELRGI